MSYIKVIIIIIFIISYFILKKIKRESFYQKSKCIETKPIKYPLVNVNDDGIIEINDGTKEKIKKEFHKIKFYLNDIIHKDIYNKLYSSCEL